MSCQIQSDISALLQIMGMNVSIPITRIPVQGHYGCFLHSKLLIMRE